MKNGLALIPLLLATHAAFSLPVSDDFSDGILDPSLWSTFGRDGSTVEEDGSLHFILDTPVAGSSYAGLRLQENISYSSDFQINADITYRYPEVDKTIFGMVVYATNGSGERFAAGFLTNSSNTMGVSAYGPVEPTYSFVNGAAVASESFSFQIDYTASAGLFDFTVVVNGVSVGSISHSISGDANTDLSYDWNLASGSFLGLEIVAESLSGPVPENIIKLDNLEVVSVPEARYFSILLGSLVLVFILRHRWFRR